MCPPGCRDDVTSCVHLWSLVCSYGCCYGINMITIQLITVTNYKCVIGWLIIVWSMFTSVCYAIYTSNTNAITRQKAWSVTHFSFSLVSNFKSMEWHWAVMADSFPLNAVKEVEASRLSLKDLCFQEKKALWRPRLSILCFLSWDPLSFPPSLSLPSYCPISLSLSLLHRFISLSLSSSSSSSSSSSVFFFFPSFPLSSPSLNSKLLYLHEYLDTVLPKYKLKHIAKKRQCAVIWSHTYILSLSLSLSRSFSQFNLISIIAMTDDMKTKQTIKGKKTTMILINSNPPISLSLSAWAESHVDVGRGHSSPGQSRDPQGSTHDGGRRQDPVRHLHSGSPR